MAQNLKIILAISVIALLIFAARWFINHGKQEQIIEDQFQTIEIQDEIITENKEVFERKVINRSTSGDDDFNWLRENICQDCKSR